MVKISIYGTDYPCRPTMGTALRFKNETGKEITELADGNLSDICIYLYCCVKSACSADKIPFELSMIDFADNLAPEDVQRWAESLTNGNASEGDGEKKR